MPDNTNQFINLSSDELEQAFLAAANDPSEEGKRFFNQFKYVSDLFNNNPSAALNQGIDLLNRCHAIDEGAFARIHKGSAYYWLGIAAFLLHDYEIAAFFFDAAVSEDIRSGAHPVNNPTPALRFIQIEGDAPEQAARQLVRVTQARIQELIDSYNNDVGRYPGTVALTLPSLRSRFLMPAVMPDDENLRSLATAFISFSLEWDFRNTLLDIRPANGTSEPFFLHLFKGCVLFESLLKENPTDPPDSRTTLRDSLRHLHTRLSIPYDLSIGNVSLPDILADLETADGSIETAVSFTGKLRNTLGHNLGWVVSLNKRQYHRLFRMISYSCLHAIGCLY